MFFVYNDTIINLERVSGESNKMFYKKGYTIASMGVDSDIELKKRLAEYNMKQMK
tara:strand:+ start:386 stop:550 length:165 start_codon:yes stop_codon:yes gene_type:complete